LILEWLTLWPTKGALAVNSQRRDISKILVHPENRQARWAPRGSKLLFLLGAADV
jgi:hypothetical protein